MCAILHYLGIVFGVSLVLCFMFAPAVVVVAMVGLILDAVIEGCCGVGDCDGQCVLWCGCCGCDIGAVISLCPLVGMYVFEFVVFYSTCLLYRCEPMFCFPRES